MTEQMNGYEKGSESFNKWHDQKSREKKKLPAFLFMAGKIAETERGFAKACWRKASAITLNGLVMIDFDDLEDPRTEWEKLYVNLTEAWRERILLVHVTPSGHGLRVVFKADVNVGNIADNQLAFAEECGLPLDAACKDSSRLSYAVNASNIIYVELNELLNYENPEFDEKFGEAYRNSHSAPVRHAGNNAVDAAAATGGVAAGQGIQADGGLPAEAAEVAFPTDENGKLLFNGIIPYDDIINAIITSRGGAPSVGVRNTFYYDMVREDVRYICDFNADIIFRVMPDFGLSEEERRQAIGSALSARRYSMSKRCKAVLSGLGLSGGDDTTAVGAAKQAQFDHDALYKRFKPFYSGPWSPALSCLDDKVKLAGLLAAGAMFGTYLSPVRLLNFYDGNDWRLSFMVYIIGQAASGKGVFVELNRLIMEPLRILDEQGRKWEEKYKEDKEKRAASSKNQKSAAMEIEHFPIRVLPGTISNAMRYKRMKDAVTVINGEEVHLHCYIFESELSAKLRSEQGTWAGAQDLDCKSFSNEYGGNDYGNAQAVNGLIEVNMNQVITGTQDAMNRKITPRNCLDGLATRLVMFEMPDNSYQMLERNKIRRTMEDNHWLRTIGSKLLKCQAPVDLAQEVAVPKSYQAKYGKRTSISEALYQWGVDEAERCKDSEDKCADYFRRRAPIIAARYAAVDAILRDVDHFAQTGKLTMRFSSVLLAVELASYLQEAQMYFFGQKVMEALEDSMKAFVPERKKDSLRARTYAALPKEFSAEDLSKFYSNKKTIMNYISEWKKNGFIAKVKNLYVKLVNNI